MKSVSVEGQTDGSGDSWVQPGRLAWTWALENLDWYRRWGATPQFWEEWWRGCHDERIIEQGAELGANLALVHYYKGMGLEAEKEERDLAAQFVQKCHAHGVNVILYIQFGSLTYETILLEQPEAWSWFAEDENGQPLRYGGQYFRVFPCPTSRGYLDYLKQVIRAAVAEAGGDGLWLDNFSFRSTACYCRRCREAFRQYLRQNFPPGPQTRERFGIDDFSFVEPPPVRSIDFKEPVSQEWIRFRTQCLTQDLEELSDYARDVNPRVEVTTNCGWVPRPMNAAMQGVDIRAIGRYCNLWIAEWVGQPGISEEGVLVSTIRSFKIGQAVGMLVLPFAEVTHWSRETAELNLAEALAFGGHVMPTPTALGLAARPEIKGAKGRIGYRAHDSIYFTWHNTIFRWGWAVEDELGEAIHEITRRYTSFVKAHGEMYGGEHQADVAVYESPVSMALNWASTYPAVIGFEQALLQGHVPFDIILDLTPRTLERYRVVVLPEAACLSDEEIDRLAAYVQAGGGVVATGETSLFDEHFRRRLDYGLAQALGFELDEAQVTRCSREQGRLVFLPAGMDKGAQYMRPCPDQPTGAATPSPWELAHGLSSYCVRPYPELPGQWTELLEAVRWSGSGSWLLDTDADAYVLADVYRKDGRHLIHLVDFKLREALHDFQLRVHLPSGSQVGQVRLWCPYLAEAQDVSWSIEDDVVTVVVAGLRSYGVLEIL